MNGRAHAVTFQCLMNSIAINLFIVLLRKGYGAGNRSAAALILPVCLFVCFRPTEFWGTVHEPGFFLDY